MIPFAAGGGPLFTPDAHPGRLRLVGSTSRASGILELEYPHGWLERGDTTRVMR
jgi:hypothetical protein